MNVSLRPEHLTIADETARHRWVAETAERTLDRLDSFDETDNEYAQMAHDRYGEMGSTYREAVVKALEQLDESEPVPIGGNADD